MTSVEKLDAIQDLMDEILEIQKNSKDLETMEKVQEIIQSSSKLVENSLLPLEMVADARILHTGSQVLNARISSFDTNLTSFNEQEYSRGILNYLNSNVTGLSVSKSWECFAPATYHIFRRSHSFTFMLGSLTVSTPPPPPLKDRKRPKVASKQASKEEVKLSTSEKSSEDSAVEESSIYEHILKSLVRCYKLNNKKPIPFISFVIDPKNYWHSLENIFYFSFLVRDGRVNLFLDDEGLPIVEPVRKSTDTTAVQNRQFSFSLSKEDWRECIEKFSISAARIERFKQT